MTNREIAELVAILIALPAQDRTEIVEMIRMRGAAVGLQLPEGFPADPLAAART